MNNKYVLKTGTLLTNENHTVGKEIDDIKFTTYIIRGETVEEVIHKQIINMVIVAAKHEMSAEYFSDSEKLSEYIQNITSSLSKALTSSYKYE